MKKYFYRIIEDGISLIQRMAHQTAKAKGFHDNSYGLLEAESLAKAGQAIALMHSELSEALEALRKGNWQHQKGSVVEELADVIIRIGDFCDLHGLDLGRAVVDKMIANEKREHRHGKKF